MNEQADSERPVSLRKLQAMSAGPNHRWIGLESTAGCKATGAPVQDPTRLAILPPRCKIAAEMSFLSSHGASWAIESVIEQRRFALDHLHLLPFPLQETQAEDQGGGSHPAGDDVPPQHEAAAEEPFAQQANRDRRKA